jgi:threonine dehydrogenase-like Zn-dependent dehydrogenase
VLGHESVGDVVDAGAGVKNVKAGDRVAVNPLLCCEARGVSPVCAACRDGHHQRCAHFTDGALSPGMLIGTTRSTGGSWGEEFVAHDSQLVPMPAHLADEEAVLIEPFACSVHAARLDPLRSSDRVLVIGAGSIGLLTTAALRALSPSAQITVLARHDFQAAHAHRLGAARVVRARGTYLQELADVAQTRLLKPIIGRPIGRGGFDRTFVCITGVRGMEDAMRFTREGGTIVLLGNTTSLNGLDWTPLWIKELSIKGSLCYGAHKHGSATESDFATATQLIATRVADVRGLVTHTFPLAEYRRAIATALDKRGAGSVKVAFRYR